MKTLNWNSLTVADAFFVRNDRSNDRHEEYVHLALWVEEKLYKLLEKSGGPAYEIRMDIWYVDKGGTVGVKQGYSYKLHSPDTIKTEHDARFLASKGAEGRTWYFLSYRLQGTTVPDVHRLLGVRIALPAINANVQGGKKIVDSQRFTLFNKEELLGCLIAGVRNITQADNCKMHRCDCDGDAPCLSHVLATLELMEHGMLMGHRELVQLAHDKYKLLCPECRQC